MTALGGPGERLPQPLPGAPSVSSPDGQVEANSSRHPAVGADRSPEQRPRRACPTYTSLYTEAHGSWQGAWREVYG